VLNALNGVLPVIHPAIAFWEKRKLDRYTAGRSRRQD